jgi:hypothetical protein
MLEKVSRASEIFYPRATNMQRQGFARGKTPHKRAHPNLTR